MMLDRDICYRALLARDARFDGRFFVAVRTTNIYCRPICPARFPNLENCTFYDNAAAAQDAGYRPCLRCRPEVAPELAAWRGSGAVIGRAMQLVEGGALDDGSVNQLAGRLGLGERHLRRLFMQHVGVSPLAVAQARRVHLAKQLVTETGLSFADIALASGFGSVRRFNHCFQHLYGRPPSQLRRQPKTFDASDTGSATLLLPYSEPYDWPGMLAGLAAHALTGIEVASDSCYARTIAVQGASGIVKVRRALDHRRGSALMATITLTNWAALPQVVRQLKDMFDLAADPSAINRHLAQDPLLAPSVKRHPGLRIAGGADSFELAVRTVLAEHVSPQAARAMGGRLVAAFGQRLPPDLAVGGAGLSHQFPDAAALATADLAAVGITPAAAAINALARAALADARPFSTAVPLDETVARLTQIPGISQRVAQQIAMHALRHPDAFPQTPDTALAPERTESWRPWRAYAAAHLQAISNKG